MVVNLKEGGKYMNKKYLFLAVLLAFSVAIVPCLTAAGNHTGEQAMLDVDIQFLNSYGTTVTNAQGTFYNYYGMTFREDKVYPSQYWGTYALYFFDGPTTINVRVTNKGPRAKAKIRIKTEAYVLRTDGSSGASLMTPRTIDIELAKGETRNIDASFVLPYNPSLESGLDRFLVKVLHINEGVSGREPGLIMVKEGVYCPPEYIKK